jgi:hypothetical protein
MKTYSRVGGVIVVLMLLLAAPTVHAQRPAAGERHKAVSEIDSGIEKHARQAIENGRRVFRFELGLTEQNKAELGEYLKSL